MDSKMATCMTELELEQKLNGSLSSGSTQFEKDFNHVLTTIALPTVCVFGIVGNILNLTILTRRKLQKSFRSLEQAANLCLIALAVSDLMVCALAFLYTFVPNNVYHGKGFLFFYKTYSTAFINVFIMESTMLTVAMSLERYMAICFPLRQDLYLTTRRIKYIIVGSFIFSFAFNVPVLWRYQAHLICPQTNPNSSLLGETTEPFKYNFSSETLVSAHFKEDEIPISPKNRSSLMLVSSNLSSPSFTLSSSSSQDRRSISLSPSSSSLLESVLSSSTPSPISSSSSSSSSTSSLPKLPSSSSSSSSLSGDRYYVEQVNLWGSQAYDLAYRICWAIVGNFIPLVLLFYFNVCLCRNIYLSYKLRKQFKRQNQAKSSSHILTITLVVIVVMFFILVAPSEIVLLTEAPGTTENVFNFLQSLNFSLNFILYCIISRHFRKTLKYLCLCGCYNIYQVSRDWKKEFETSLM